MFSFVAYWHCQHKWLNPGLLLLHLACCFNQPLWHLETQLSFQLSWALDRNQTSNLKRKCTYFRDGNVSGTSRRVWQADCFLVWRLGTWQSSTRKGWLRWGEHTFQNSDLTRWKVMPCMVVAEPKECGSKWWQEKVGRRLSRFMLRLR